MRPASHQVSDVERFASFGIDMQTIAMTNAPGAEQRPTPSGARSTDIGVVITYHPRVAPDRVQFAHNAGELSRRWFSRTVATTQGGELKPHAASSKMRWVKISGLLVATASNQPRSAQDIEQFEDIRVGWVELAQWSEIMLGKVPSRLTQRYVRNQAFDEFVEPIADEQS